MRVQAVQKMVCEARGVEHGEISRNMCDFFPSPPFFTAQFGQPSNKTISEHGNPGPRLHEDTLPASPACAAGPAETGGQVDFLPGGPFEVAARPLPLRA